MLELDYFLFTFVCVVYSLFMLNFADFSMHKFWKWMALYDIYIHWCFVIFKLILHIVIIVDVGYKKDCEIRLEKITNIIIMSKMIILFFSINADAVKMI